MIEEFAIGVALGAATGIPLGVVNVAVVEASMRMGARTGAAIGVGGALADGIHASLAFAGIAPLVTEHALARRLLLVASAIVVIGYAILVARRRGTPTPPAGRWRGVALGLSLTLPNPAPLAAWITVGHVVVPGATTAVALVAAIGVMLGSAAWFTLLARIAGRRALDGAAARWAARVVAVALFAMVGVALARELF